MAQPGIYREAPPAGGLPFPRANLGAYTAAVVVLGLLAIGMPFVVLVAIGRGGAGAWRIFRDGGSSMWLLVLLALVVPVAIAALGVFLVRGKGVPSALLFAFAGLPFGVALLGAYSGHKMVLGAISGESVDPEMKMRILAEGVAETMSTDILGGLVACGAAILAAVACASAVASIDVRAVERQGGRAGSIAPAAAVGGAWLLATIVVAVLRLRAAGPLVVLPVLATATLVPFAVLAARAAPVLRTWHDRAEARRAAAALVVAALAALLALLALERALDASQTARAFSAISGESVDDSQRARILGAALEAVKLAPVAYVVFVALAAATFGVALARAGNPLSPNAVASVVFGVVLLAGALGVAHARTAAPRLFASYKPGPPDVTLPVVVAAFSHKGSIGYGEPIVVKKDASGSGSMPANCGSGAPARRVLADRDATLAMLRARVGPPTRSCNYALVFVVERQHPKEIDDKLGDLAGYLGHTAYVPLDLDAQSIGVTSEELHVQVVADDAVEVNGVRHALPLGTLPPAEESGPTVHLVRYAFRKTDTIGRVFETIAAVENAYGARLSSYDLNRTLDDGERPPAPTLTDSGLGPPLGVIGTVGGGSSVPISMRAGAVQVNGRLPPEVVQRIVRQSFGRIRMCYQTGLRANPKLAGRVAVKFVIDREGNVSTVRDGGSTLPDQSVITCIVRAFGNLSFPQPEGGIVTVVYPIELSVEGT
ncbi:MAG TPA: AgmX/PglI C-terminal domain-containing protein [Labilithrix sp.]